MHYNVIILIGNVSAKEEVISDASGLSTGIALGSVAVVAVIAVVLVVAVLFIKFKKSSESQTL